jgi:hypothetical protein
MAEQPLGRMTPSDWRHVDTYPLTVASLPQLPVPVVLGVAWYTDFDQPQPVTLPGIRNAWMIGRDSNNLGRIRGGHCVCIRPAGMRDLTPWWMFYDQGSEGACVGFTWRRRRLMNGRVKTIQERASEPGWMSFVRWVIANAEARELYPQIRRRAYPRTGGLPRSMRSVRVFSRRTTTG